MKKQEYPPICRIVIAINLIIVACFFLYYCYKAVQFNKKVTLFNNTIHIGMTEVEVFTWLGRPSFDLQGVDLPRRIKEKNLTENTADEFVYKGRFYLREDLILYFDSKTKALIYKKRGWADIFY